ncbi:MAG: preprotein translocase subunit Sec61beta [Desulfurococcales archaeon ex4484_42]|nr:MAG: preprotein translocase subunit Sec61beta [Desulfurococcales archaeon ex4484_42]
MSSRRRRRRREAGGPMAAAGLVRFFEETEAPFVISPKMVIIVSFMFIGVVILMNFLLRPPGG